MRSLPTNQLVNTDFPGGSSDNWRLETGWAIGAGGCPPPGCTGYVATFTGPGTAAVTNLTNIACIPGGAVKAQCWALGEHGASGFAALRINFYDINQQIIWQSHNSAWVTNNYVWQFVTVFAIAPTGATYATIDFAVYYSTSGGPRWFATNFFGAYLLQSLGRDLPRYKLPLQYYLNLFTSQYKGSTRLLQWQTALSQPLDDLTNCLQTVNIAYDLDNAIGDQLDVLGEIIGQSRTLPFQPSGGVSAVMDDDTYRLVLYATQAKNTWDGTIESVYQSWRFIFPDGLMTIVDNQNMTATITTSGDFTSLETDLINKGFIVPRPEGVQYNATGGSGVGLFGFDRNDATVSGFDIGTFA